MGKAKKKEDKQEQSLLEQHGFSSEETMEIRRMHAPAKTGYPKPLKRYRLWIQGENLNLENVYFWMVGHLSTDFGLYNLEKITDIQAASVSSSIFGDMQARLTAQQNQATQLLGTIGKMTKDLFALVRELRQLKERLGYYKDLDKGKDIAAAAEKTLKGIWIDLVEGGTQNPSSVLGLANKVGYTILPDLFFNAPPLDEEGVKKYVDSLEFNDHVKNMLTRKLMQFSIWKAETEKELQAKKNFQIRILRQHFDTIRMYMNWVKPYLRQVELLNMNQSRTDKDSPLRGHAHMESGYLINTFQGNLVEVESLTYGQPHKGGDTEFYPCVLVHCFYRTTPSMDFHARDAYHQKGPIHIGRVEVTLRAYGWSKEEIESYKKLRMKQDWELLVNIDRSLMDAMRLLGDDLVEFLEEAEMELPEGFADIGKKKDDEDAVKEPTAAEPFLGVIGGFKELFGPLVSVPKIDFSRGKQAAAKMANDGARKKATGMALMACWNTYKNYKKAHGLVTW